MNNNLSSQDLELLSAYLDQELETVEVERLEARLTSDVNLSAALNEMQKTRQVLRSLPLIRAPHNFTLTPEMVGLKPRKENRTLRWFSGLRLSSALAAILLVLVLAGDFLTGVTIPSTTSLTGYPMEAPAAEETLKEMPPDLSALQSADSLEGAMVPTPTPQPNIVQPEIAGEAALEESESVELLPTPEGPTPFPQQLPRGIGGGGGGADDSEVQIPASEPLLTAYQLRTAIRVTEVLLAIAVITTAAAAWILRRRS